MTLPNENRAELEALGPATVRLMLMQGGPGRGASISGFRSAFRDWSSERTNFAREICALAHIVKDKTEAAYRRGDLFEKRRELMAAWAAFATTTNAEIIPFRRLS
jgi:hypothetical protein